MARVNRLLQTTLAELLPRLLKDPRLGAVPFVSISAVRATGDLSRARVFVVMPADAETDRDAVLAALRRSRGFLRRELGRRLRLRRIPELAFELDPVPEQAARIEALLDEVRAQTAGAEGEADAAADGEAGAPDGGRSDGEPGAAPRGDVGSRGGDDRSAGGGGA